MDDVRQLSHAQIRKAIGIGVAVCASILSLLELYFFYHIEGYSLLKAVQQPSVFLVFLIGIIFLFTSINKNRGVYLTQVMIIIFSGYFSAFSAKSGDLTGFVIIMVGYLLALEYGFLNKNVIPKTVLFVTAYIASRIMGMSVYQDIELVVTFHSMVGAGMFIYIFFIIVYCIIQRENAHKENLESQVEARTKDLKKVIEEKEVLLKEVHHRTKNNMQLVSSLINLEYSDVEDENAREAAYNSMRRIQTLATAHEHLYQSGSITSINLKDYIEGFISVLMDDLGEYNLKLQCSVDPGIESNIEGAIPLGLTLNELLSNAMKYAFSEKGDPEIAIELQQKDSQLEFIFTDNGSGFSDDFEHLSGNSLGIQIVVNLIDQLGGTYSIDSGNGVAWKIVLPLAWKPEKIVSGTPVFYLKS